PGGRAVFHTTLVSGPSSAGNGASSTGRPELLGPRNWDQSDARAPSGKVTAVSTVIPTTLASWFITFFRRCAPLAGGAWGRKRSRSGAGAEGVGESLEANAKPSACPGKGRTTDLRGLHQGEGFSFFSAFWAASLTSFRLSRSASVSFSSTAL